MMRNTLPPILGQLVSPALQLSREGLNTADLLNFEHFDSCGAVVAEMCVWQLNDQVGGVVVDVFTEFFKHLDCGADLGVGVCIIKCECHARVCG